MNGIFFIFVGLLFFYFIIEATLLLLNSKCALKNLTAGNRFKDFIDTETYTKSVSYTLAKNQFDLMTLFYSTLVLGCILFSGILPIFYYALRKFTGNGVWGEATTLFLIFFFHHCLLLPLDYLKQFSLEQRYGFNRSTKKLWLTDQIKGSLLSLIIFIPLLAFLLKLIKRLPLSWWLFGSLFWIFFQVLLIWLYPKLILPFFNRLKPLEEGLLKDRLNTLALKAGFRSTAIQVLDSSKRSAHSNAYCSSLGHIQHIVLYDTLLKNFSEEEIEAIIAHEIGHYRKRHIAKLLIFSGMMTLLGLKFFHWLTQQAVAYSAFGFQVQDGITPLLVVLGLSSVFLLYWLKPLNNLLSRKYEYEADAFAKKLANNGGYFLIQALKKLYKENLGNLHPHPFYSFFHYSHPTFLERESRLKN